MDTIILFVFLTGAIAATLFFIQGAFWLAGSSPRRGMRAAREFIFGTRSLSLARSRENPVLGRTDNAWEAAAVMNPAVVYADGLVHLFYRAIGMDGVSRIGYAASEDGIHFNTRLPYPVFMMKDGDAERDRKLRAAYNPELYAALLASGGSWSGVEDPRAIRIGNRIYLSFQVFRGWDSLRVGVASISLDDVERHRWNWTSPLFLSAPNEVNKNWVIFPRKINGKYAVLHGFRAGTRRRAVIEYLDTLDEEPDEYIHSNAKFRDDAKEFDDNVWDGRIRGAGPPPVETSQGWLVFYHANDLREPGRYKLGCVLLDRDQPTKVIARSPYPVLEPDMPYENEGKAGIIYATGAIVKDGMLIVYYGGGDNVICAAAVPLSDFMSALMSRKKPAFPVRARSTLSPAAA